MTSQGTEAPGNFKDTFKSIMLNTHSSSRRSSRTLRIQREILPSESSNSGHRPTANYNIVGCVHQQKYVQIIAQRRGGSFDEVRP